MPSANSTPSSRPQTPTTSARGGSGIGGGGSGGATGGTNTGGGGSEKTNSGGGLASMTAATIASNDIIGPDGNVSVIGDGYFGQASSSKLTLDELKKRKLEEAHNRIDLLVKAHERDLQELCFALHRNDKFEMDGSPAIPAADDQFELTDPESAKFQHMLQIYNIRDGKSIKDLDIPTLDEAREAILKDIARNRTLKLPIRARDLSIGHGRTSISSSSSSNAAAPASAAQATGLGENKIMPPPASTPIKGEPLDRQKKAIPLASPAIPVSIPLSAVPKMPAVNVVPKLPIPTDPLPLATAPPTSPLITPPSTSLTIPSASQTSGSPAENQSQSTQGDTGSQADSQLIASQSTALTVPNLIASQQGIHGSPPSGTPASSESPLHPTLQVLSPNPLSVTYASSLRPLPPDPFRRFTGVGVGGGAIHHRGHRKAPQLPAKNGVPPAAGPAGAGGVDLYKWAVRARASPGAGLVGKADKCLLTNDWKVAFTEQRFIRTMNKIEKLKSEGLWSFRQPKKQKGPVVRKAHWDHLLEELKWLQTDFKEERRWKIAVAFTLANAARDYVRAKSPQARARMTIKARPIRHLEEREMDIDAKEEQVEEDIAIAEEEDEKADAEEDIAMEEDQKEKDAALTEEDQDAVAEAVDDAVADIDADADADADGEEDAPGEDDMDAEGEDDDGEVEAATGLLVDNDKPDEPVEIVHKDLPPVHMPALTGDAQQKDQIASNISDPSQQGISGIKAESNNKNATLTSEDIPINVAASIRAPIFSLGVVATTVSPVTLLEHTDSNALAEMLGISTHELGERITLDQLSLSALFPELPLFDAPAAPQFGKGDRRWDDGSLNQAPRLTHVSRLMDSKPVLVSTLQPARNRAHERWREEGEWNLAAQMADPSKGVAPEVLDAVPPPGSVLFTRKSNKPSRDTSHAAATVPLPAAPANAEARATQFLWTSEEDDYLLSLIKQYGQHWQLISDLFNATRLSVPTDFREAWDCYDRYQRIQQAASEGKAPPPPSFLTEKADDSKANGSQNGQSSNSLAMKREKLTKKVGLKYDGSRKKLRKSNITEVMKKCAKRRAETQQRSFSQPKQVNLQSHETHNQIKIGLTPSPQQLSLMKADRDEANARQFALMQQQQRQAQQQAAAQAQQAAQQAAQQQQQQQQVVQQQQGSQSQAQSQPQTQAQVPASAPTPQQQLTAQQQHQQQLHAQQQRLMQQLQAQQQQGRPQMPQQAQPAQQQSQPTQQQQQQAQQRFAQQATAGQTQQQGQTAQQTPNQQAINFAARPPTNQAGRMPVNAAATANAQGGAQRPANATGGPSIPPQLAALQATLTQTLSNNPAFTPEQINTLALQLFRQAQQQGGLNNINLGGGVNANNNAAGQQQARPAAGAGQGQQRPPAGQAQGQTTQVRPAANTNGGANKAQSGAAANKQTKPQTPAKAQTSVANKSQPNVRPAPNTSKAGSTTPSGSSTNAAPVNTAAIAAAVKAATAAGQKASGNANANSQTASPSTPNATSASKTAQTKK